MTRLAIIADDLTGALDSAAPFAMRGLRTLVALTPAGLQEALGQGADIVAASADSRELAPDAARAAVGACHAQLPAQQAIFKKVDSRLKGNIAAELDAIPHRRALVVPAIPAFGRWVHKGVLSGFGVDEPVDIAARLGAHAGTAHVPDALVQSDIEAAVAEGDYDLPVGARALAEAMAERMAPEGRAPAPTLAARRVIAIIGSADPITREQVETLRRGMPDLAYIAAPGGETPEALPLASALTLVQAVPGARPVDATTVAERLGEVLARLEPEPGTLLVITGGATAQAVLARIGIAVLEVVGEALPGLPIARAEGFTIITKSGGFGEPDTLLRLLGHVTATPVENIG
ncbi:four-carbon acid sugar kinase family protein [Devosia nitrariae]|uniref:Four-carbon acid sugar kinase family protein n=1 Tax=Devosia nitrariae TaxID=2071872 RepID=A0ABQ5WA27_9HYPH|nr:four-carbon acid sugar kinase family protein [Devosia nitrariae]GLQ56964.1 hypothetical protein GCM10010862_42230 [Devosia nitrariae]